jgi:hypothetical protein
MGIDEARKNAIAIFAVMDRVGDRRKRRIDADPSTERQR